MKKIKLVFVLVPGRGHIASAIEFAKRLLHSDERISITVLVIKWPGSPELNSYVEDLAASNPNIQFIPLPHVDPPAAPPQLKQSIEKFISDHLENHKSVFTESIIHHVLSDPNVQLGGLVLDFFCSSMIDVANELSVPAYVFFTSGAAFMGLTLYLPARHARVGYEFTISDPDPIIPAYSNPVPTRVLPSFLFDSGGYSAILTHGARLKLANGLIINTFAELEPYAIQLLTSDKEVPTIYPVGPMLSFHIEKHPDSGKILEWLDDKPTSSVVFLCFGSNGGFEPPQLAEIAAALEQSGLKFLWSVQAPPPKEFTYNTKQPDYSNFPEILPEGFLERTKGRGLVCGWTPQLEVLAHKSIGGFVSHCGWNSILESVWNGVPIATWPIYAEQQTNAFQLVKELEIAVELTLDYRFVNPDRIVLANDIEKALKCLMDSENPVRKRVKEMQEKSRKALEEGGSSSVSLGSFIEDVILQKS